MSRSRLSLACCALLLVGCSDPSDGPAPRFAASPRLVAKEPSGNAGAGGEAPTSGEAPSSVAGAGAGAPNEPAPTACERSQFVLRPDVSNARDLGGVPLSPSGEVSCGAVYRGPPLRLMESGCTQFQALGIRTVIDLRVDGERSAEAACVTSRVLAAPLPVPYGLGPDDYLRVLDTTESMAQIFHTLGDESAYPVYFHCTYGRDRTGVVAALLLLALGATRETVMQEYMLSQPNVGAYPNALTAVLDAIEARGGAEAVLTSLGISADEIAVLRSHVH